jgi:hypothetical protein
MNFMQINIKHLFFCLYFYLLYSLIQPPNQQAIKDKMTKINFLTIQYDDI